MSTNKTVVPGMVNAYEPQSQTQATWGNSAQQTPQPQPQQAAYNATYFPGMPSVNQTAPQGGTTPQTGAPEIHKTVMGFLYSVSRTSCGEYWPLYMGLNTVGRSTSCSVRLSEATISDNHAEIVIRQMKNPDSVLVSIQDARSTCGTLLNGSSLGFDPHEMHNGDIITVGEHYELYFILVDTKSLGLAPRQDFIPAAGIATPMQGNMMPNPSMNMGNPTPNMFTAPQPQYPNPSNMAGGNAGYNNKSTIIIPAKK